MCSPPRARVCGPRTTPRSPIGPVYRSPAAALLLWFCRRVFTMSSGKMIDVPSMPARPPTSSLYCSGTMGSFFIAGIVAGRGGLAVCFERKPFQEKAARQRATLSDTLTRVEIGNDSMMIPPTAPL